MNESTTANDSRGPARPAKLTVRLAEQADSLALHFKRGRGPWVFLLLWLIGWTVGCVFLLASVIANPHGGMLLFAVPFWASWLFVAAMVIWFMFGKEVLYLDRDEARFVRTAIIRLKSVSVPRREIKGFQECRSKHTENEQYLWGIEMVALGVPLRFAFRLADRERAWLIHRLNQFLQSSETVGQVQRSVAAPDDPQKKLNTDLTGSDDSNEDAEVLTLERTLAEPPSDCRWRLEEDVDTHIFRQRGRWNLGALGSLLFINAFWNGIVSVFVAVLFGLMPGEKNPPEGIMWWGLFVFLIPFEAIGLTMFVMLVRAILEPWHQTEWHFDREQIARQIRWPFVRRTQAWDLSSFERLELRGQSDGSSNTSWTGLYSGTHFNLALVDTSNVDLCIIDNLTEGEARWMARKLLGGRRK